MKHVGAKVVVPGLLLHYSLPKNLAHVSQVSGYSRWEGEGMCGIKSPGEAQFLLIGPQHHLQIYGLDADAILE